MHDLMLITSGKSVMFCGFASAKRNEGGNYSDIFLLQSFSSWMMYINFSHVRAQGPVVLMYDLYNQKWRCT